MEKTIEKPIISHHDLPTFTGYTDIALLTLQLCTNRGTIDYVALKFSSDGRCKIYFDKDCACDIPDHYVLGKEISGNGWGIAWIRVYSDESAIMNERCDRDGVKGLRIWRAGNSAIISLFDLKDGD